MAIEKASQQQQMMSETYFEPLEPNVFNKLFLNVNAQLKSKQPQ